ncbi:MAG: dihydrofolate reductase [Clostridiales bacterium]|jgi:dihydrofolate reductase|nr:dihydrofolate reductase [Clostridiales bacterium]
MNIIAALDKNCGIGYQNRLLYRIPEDMQYFKALTTGKVVVMGRSTLNSFPGGLPLPNRINAVLSRDASLRIENAAVFNSIAALLDFLKAYPAEDVFVIGGETVYEQLIDLCDTAYLTEIDAERPADAFFTKKIFAPPWRKTHRSETKEFDGLKYAFCVYKKDLTPVD